MLMIGLTIRIQRATLLSVMLSFAASDNTFEQQNVSYVYLIKEPMHLVTQTQILIRYGN